MSGGFEGAADAVSGGVFGRAVEPRAGEGHGDAPHDLCLNCGTALIGEHCHACGQSAHTHRTVGAIGHEIAHGVFHFEGKMFRTLPMLALHPGDLTRRYIAGERARFVSPLAIFLFSVFLMFAIVANLPGWHIPEGDFLNNGVQGGMAVARGTLTETRKQATAVLVETRERLAKEQAKPAPNRARVGQLQERLATTTKSLADITTAERTLPVTTSFEVENTSALASDNWIEAKFRHARANPQLVLYKMKTSAYKFGWALIPLSVPFLWLLFPFNRRFGLYDHAIFATYSLTFMSLLTILLALLGATGVPREALWTAAAIIPPIHIYKQMKGTYGLGRTSALIRTVLLAWLIFVAIIPVFVVALVYLGVAD